MNIENFKFVLRNAVLAALPLSQVACTTEPAPAPTPPATIQPPAPEIVQPRTMDECFGPEQRATGHQKLAGPFPNDRPNTAEACMDICKTLLSVQTRSPGGNRLENVQISHCAVTTGVSQPMHFNCSVSYELVMPNYLRKSGCPVPGRMPEGCNIELAETQTAQALGNYFANMVAMETAAITAFDYLVRELTAYQAPQALIDLALAAIQEETEHAQMAGLLAQAYTTEPSPLALQDFQLRSLYEIALENAVEGCINETFAAACGWWQAERAEFASFRTVIAHISEEETRHAALSWAIHAWAMPQLTELQRAQIQQAQIEALTSLEASFQQEAHPSLQRELGLPNALEAAQLFKQLRADVWSQPLFG